MAAVPQPRMSAEEKRWRAESDARTMLEANKIAQDRSRISAAKKVAREQASALQKVAGRKPAGKKGK